MATTNAKIVTVIANQNLTAADYGTMMELVAHAGGEARAQKANATTDIVVGVNATAGAVASGTEFSMWHVNTSEVVKVKTAEVITAGELVGANASGLAVGYANNAAVPAGGMVIGIALKTGSSGEVIPVMCAPFTKAA